VQLRADSRKFKISTYLFRFKARCDLLFKDYKFILHLWVDVAFIFCGPKTPESITNYIALLCNLLIPEYVIS